MPRAKSMSPADYPDPDDELQLDPIVGGLLDRLPEPGTVWLKTEQQKWLQILSQTFDLIYRQPDPDAKG